MSCLVNSLKALIILTHDGRIHNCYNEIFITEGEYVDDQSKNVALVLKNVLEICVNHEECLRNFCEIFYMNGESYYLHHFPTLSIIKTFIFTIFRRGYVTILILSSSSDP